jgi:hypothetical protein
MRRRIFYSLSRHLAILLETGIRGEVGENRLPVFLCHPLDALGGEDHPEETHARGVLYLYRITPDRRYRQAPLSLEPPRRKGSDAGAVELVPPAGRAAGMRLPGLWVRLRYAFLVVGGTLEEELEALAAALETLEEHPLVSTAALLDADGLALAAEDEEAPGEMEVDALPLRLLDEPEAWRELGLAEHHLSVVFEVALPLGSRQLEPAAWILERRVVVEHRRPDGDNEESDGEGER